MMFPNAKHRPWKYFCRDCIISCVKFSYTTAASPEFIWPWIYMAPNLHDPKFIWPLNLYDPEFIWSRIYMTLNLYDPEFIWPCIYMDLVNQRGKKHGTICLPLAAGSLKKKEKKWVWIRMCSCKVGGPPEFYLPLQPWPHPTSRLAWVSGSFTGRYPSLLNALVLRVLNQSPSPVVAGETRQSLKAIQFTENT